MSIRDHTSQRLFVAPNLTAGTTFAATADQANYLRNVLRLQAGARLAVFNGRDGEWTAEIAEAGKRLVTLHAIEQRRGQVDGPDLHYLFAPLKRARLDYMVQKAVEMGVARLTPVITRHTVAERVNGDRMRANAVEAAEQCGILRVPAIDAPVALANLLAAWDGARRIVFCDEAQAPACPIEALRGLGRGPLAVLIGPEGGFDQDERRLLRGRPFVTAIALGPRIMRADTAAVAALALVNAVLGDWA